MTTLHGFELIREAEIAEIRSWARLYRHVRTGAQLLSVENSDENKCFGIAFTTPPPDDTGLPHILEHSVLCGSRRYPTKEPFVELLKTSLNTFLNAMTFDDFTVYPVASTNLQDFYNLVNVYMDAVFYPLINENTLKQEGWHYELDTPDAPLTYKGVVFNEMKSMYSTPEWVQRAVIAKALLPDTPYANDAGGDPSVMPDLTYPQFKAFHETYYHPSNARIYFYGDDDPRERLRMVDEFIAEFERREVDARLPLQPRFDAPRTVEVGYDAGDTPGENKSLVTVTWLLPEIVDNNRVMALNLLSHILIETPASPLRKALIDSGLGEDLTGEGFSTYQREAVFGTGLKGVSRGNAGKVEPLILDTLRALVADGIAPETINASMNTVEFELREMNTGRFPRGLMMFLRSLPNWIHGGDPLEKMAFGAQIDYVKDALAQNPRFFEELIEQYLLNNPHRVTVLMHPDPQAGERRDAAERARLERARAHMTESDLKQVIADAAELRRIQETPDDPADVAKIPTLKLSDIEREIRTIPLEALEVSGARVLYHDLPTNDILYLDLALDLHTLPEQYIPYIGVFGRVLLEMGTHDADFVALTQRIGAKTGGIDATALTGTTVSDQKGVAYSVLRAKCLPHQVDDLFAILNDILLNVNLNNPERLLQLVLEDKAQMEAYISLVGQMYINYRLNAHFSEEGWVNEQISGISQLMFLRQLAERIQSDWAGVRGDLEAIMRLLVNRNSLLVNVTLDAANWASVQPRLAAFLAGIPAQPVQTHTWARAPLPAAEAIAVPAQVNFVGKAANLLELGYEPDGSAAVVLKTLNLDYLWNRIRVQGGAYGGAGRFNPFTGVMTFLSWRDPNLTGTLSTYDAAADYLARLELSDDELEKAIIGAVGDLDAYQLPDAKGYTSLSRYLIGYDDTLRQQYRDELLSTTQKDFKAFGAVLARMKDAAKIAVVTSPASAQQANESGAVSLTVTRVL